MFGKKISKLSSAKEVFKKEITPNIAACIKNSRFIPIVKDIFTNLGSKFLKLVVMHFLKVQNK